jgi:hypothetical protein
MAFKNIQLQTVAEGKTADLVLHQIRGPKGPPTLKVEHLGETNTSYWLDSLSRAKAEMYTQAAMKKDLSPQEMARKLREARARKREVVTLHAVRDIENLFHDDGMPATKADIPDFIASLPDDVFDTVWMFAEDANNFRDAPVFSSAAEVAGK